MKKEIDSTLVRTGNGNTEPREYVTERVRDGIHEAGADLGLLPVIEIFRTIEGEGTQVFQDAQDREGGKSRPRAV